MEVDGIPIGGVIESLAGRFGLKGSLIAAGPCGEGHINRTYAAEYRNGRGPLHYIHQRINHQVFKNPPALMKNIEIVTGHIRRVLEAEGASDIGRRVLTLVTTPQGCSFVRDEEGWYWRTYVYIEGSKTCQVLPDRATAREVSRAFARFQRQLAGLPPESLEETIPRFHDTPWRFDNLVKAVEADRAGRAASVRAEIDFALSHAADTQVLAEAQARGRLPMRITHNDTKVNNILLDRGSGEALCVIDLDTVMPGLSLYDFGDMVRSGIATAEEDERDLARVDCNLDLFAGLVEGYLEEAGTLLTAAERGYLAFSGKLVTLEMGLRFLTDYLEGDVYYSIKRPSHNLDRARTQFKMVARMEQLADRMQAVVERGAAL